MNVTAAQAQRADSILEDVAESLDISPTKRRQAVERYTAIGNWLCQDQGALSLYRPDVYVQGSFRLGTVVRPIKHGNEREYDIDLVCRLNSAKRTVTPSWVKKIVGSRLEANETYQRMLDDEGRRCWTLEYAEEDGIGFHVDVVPSVDEDSTTKMTLAQAGVPQEFAIHALALTEKELGQYAWTASNPKGYAGWFDVRNLKVLQRIKAKQKQLLYAAYRDSYASVESIPDQDVRTPLQRAIQILKRHRDLRFSGTKLEEFQPISILITTLAAKAYRDEETVFGALEGIINRVENYGLSSLILKNHGRWDIPNPVNPKENFADRWNEPGSPRPEAFFQWVKWVRDDLDAILQVDTPAEWEQLLSPKLGGRAVKDAITRRSTRGSSDTTALPAIARPQGGPLMVPHRELPKWRMSLQYQVDITATHFRQGGTSQVFRSDSSLLTKNLSLSFHARTNAPIGHQIFWQVVNTGAEAERAGGLRGNIFPGRDIHKESTLYKGTHWVQCFVVLGEVCVARSPEFIVRIG